jgi:hypothetical protein
MQKKIVVLCVGYAFNNCIDEIGLKKVRFREMQKAELIPYICFFVLISNICVMLGEFLIKRIQNFKKKKTQQEQLYYCTQNTLCIRRFISLLFEYAINNNGSSQTEYMLI